MENFQLTTPIHSGDHPTTAVAVARKIGLIGIGEETVVIVELPYS